MRRPAALLLLALAGCGRIGGGNGLPEQPSARETAQCHADLTAMGVQFRALPDRDTGKGCGLHGTVQLLDIGVPVTNLGAVRCGMARRFVGWVRDEAQPAAADLLGSPLNRVESFGSYACRKVVGTANPSNQLSGHAIANAIDVAGFVLADGRRVTVARDWPARGGEDPARAAFLHRVRDGACRRVGTVLSPDYNAAHHDHLHLEDQRIGFCR